MLGWCAGGPLRQGACRHDRRHVRQPGQPAGPGGLRPRRGARRPVYNYWLGGTTNYPADQEAAEQAAGSYLVVSHPANDIDAESMPEMASRLNRLMSQRVTLRGHAEVARFFGGLELVASGVVRIPEWRPDSPADVATPATVWGGVGRKP
jgi:S-adenosyl methyltransferase